jgi:hypothetical protein
LGDNAYRDKKVVGVFVRVSCAASLLMTSFLWMHLLKISDGIKTELEDVNLPTKRG